MPSAQTGKGTGSACARARPEDGRHGGGFTGINANLDAFLDSGYVTIVMTNCDEAGSLVDAKI
jgi:hypothetical protein